MKSVLTLLAIMYASLSLAQQDATPSLKSILLEQLRSTHNKQEWFVPPMMAIAGLTPEQANWKESSNNHSIAQLATHLLFWNKHVLATYNGSKPDQFNGDNKETFSPVDSVSWARTIKQLDSVLTALETAVEAADESKIRKWYSEIAHIGTHNAYHTGQMIYIRKMKGWWDDQNGVK